MLQLHEAGVPITTEDLLESSTLQGKKTIIENATRQREQAMQMQQMQMQSEMQTQQAQIELSNARAMADIGLHAERTSRVAENRALAIQKLHEANADDERAFLDRVKAIKELEEMDIGHLEKLINIANSMKEVETKTSEAGVSKVVASSPS